LLSGFLVNCQMCPSWGSSTVECSFCPLSWRCYLSFLESKVITKWLQREWLRAKTDTKWMQAFQAYPVIN
jgi:hypothetical protein